MQGRTSYEWDLDLDTGVLKKKHRNVSVGTDNFVKDNFLVFYIQHSKCIL